jgi:hypothetical protein
MPTPSIANDVLNAALQYIADNADREVVLSGLPANYAAVSGLTLAAAAIDEADFTLAAGSSTGRKVTVAAQTSVTPSATGTGKYFAIVDDVEDEILALTTCPDLPLTNGVAVNLNAWTIEMPVTQVS